MTVSERIFLWILVINTIIAVLYLLWGIFFHTKNEQEENRRIAFVIRAVIIFICPVVGLAFFLLGSLFRIVLFRIEVDLEDVMFSKLRANSLVKADEEREINVVPIEEALAVTDNTRLRELMLNVVKGDIHRSLASVALALDSEDSETAHYAASILSNALNEFRVTVRKVSQQIEQEENQYRKVKYAEMLIAYMNEVLQQQVFTNVEQNGLVHTMVSTGEIVYEYDKTALKSDMYEWLALRLIEVEDYEQADMWCQRAIDAWPDDLQSYRCRLHLLFTTGRKEEFLKVLEYLKMSGILVDSDTLELIRVFRQ